MKDRTVLKPIETVYNGYRFRSRLEARWAVFFDALNIEYKYEHQGFNLGKFGWYLPDFWLPNNNLHWIEIKPGTGEWPNHAVFEAEAMWWETEQKNLMAKVGAEAWDEKGWELENALRIKFEETFPLSSFAVICGDPWVENNDVQRWLYQEHPCSCSLDEHFHYNAFILGDCNYRWCECPKCSKVGLQFDGRSGRNCNCFDYDKVYNTHSPRLLAAYTAARQARFEHGQVGAPSEWETTQ